MCGAGSDVDLCVWNCLSGGLLGIMGYKAMRMTIKPTVCISFL